LTRAAPSFIIGRMARSLAQKAATEQLDAAVERLAERSFAFLERLVAEPSTLGHEAGAQRVLAGELERLGLAVRTLEVPESIREEPAAGYPALSYAGRPLVVGSREGSGRSLLLNGHVDVVPPGDETRWQTPPFTPVRRDGWMHGRGAGDMKSGLAMATLAIEALLECQAPLGPLTVVGVIEEECTGNGTLAAARAGVVADAVLLPECTGLELLLGGVGISWFEVTVEAPARHAARASAGDNPIEAALSLIPALRRLEREINEAHDPPARDAPYALNIAALHAGEWPSSVPETAVLQARLGFPPGWTPDDAERRVREALADGASAHPWMAEHLPAVRFHGFRAEPHALAADHELAGAVSRAHAQAHGTPPRASVGNATTDARFYLNQCGIPALCYGPRPRNIHGRDEAVELRSIVDGARTLVRLLPAWAAG
jgi:acetylornithine deacetylase